MTELLFACVIVYLLSAVSLIVGQILKKEALTRIATFAALGAFLLHTAYIIARGIVAGRVPLANQFEFATAFAWCISFLFLLLQRKKRNRWMGAIALPAIFLLLSYAMLLPKDISELMPALKSVWFAFHIGTASFSYAAFAIAAFCGLRYLLTRRKKAEEALLALDRQGYQMVAIGFVLLTLTILSGSVWAEQAWGSFWSWDPKETWALITWIIYAVYLHQRLRLKWQGKRMAIFAIVALLCVLFTFIGVNNLFSGLHSYA